jgi:hypothetical protein
MQGMLVTLRNAFCKIGFIRLHDPGELHNDRIRAIRWQKAKQATFSLRKR